MATSLQRIVAVALLAWHAALSVGGYGLHEVMGSCHPPGQQLSNRALVSTQPEVATSAGVPTRSYASATPSCRSCCCRASWTKVAKTRASDAQQIAKKKFPARESELSSATSGELMVACQLCEWLGQLSIPPSYVLPGDSIQQATEAVRGSTTIFVAPQPRYVSPRGPPSLA